MQKEVLVTLSGLQFVQDEEQMEPVEVVSPGKYYFKNGHHYVIYDEIIEGFPEVTHNTLKFTADSLEVMKKGVVNVQMLFEVNKKTLSFYQTPFGVMHLGIAATKLNLETEEEALTLDVDYALDLNDSFVADCSIHLHVQSKEKGNFRLD